MGSYYEENPNFQHMYIDSGKSAICYFLMSLMGIS